MLIYWVYTKKVILLFEKNKKKQLYYVFGIISGILLFLHVLFLGVEFQDEILKTIKKSIIILFIFFELMAQFFLIKKLLNIKEIINNFIKNVVLQIKRFFVLFFIIFTILILSLLIIFDIPKEINFMIEWNYFVILSFYYLLTFYLWKKS